MMTVISLLSAGRAAGGGTEEHGECRRRPARARPSVRAHAELRGRAEARGRPRHPCGSTLGLHLGLRLGVEVEAAEDRPPRRRAVLGDALVGGLPRLLLRDRKSGV